MCNVCCAAKAIENTAQGSWFQATWSTKPPPRLRGRAFLLNSPTAPPHPVPATALVDLQAGTEPYLLIQAEGEEEGPGRVRYGFDGETWTTWVGTQNVAAEMMNSDVVWPAVQDDVKATVLARDLAGMETLLLQRALEDLQFEVGRRVTKGLPEAPGRAGVQAALRVLRVRAQEALDGIDLLDEGRPLLLALLKWRPRQPFPRSPKGFRKALRAHLITTRDEDPRTNALRRGMQYGLFRIQELVT